jgi:hypothetical protein
LDGHLKEFALKKENVEKLKFKNYTDKELQSLYGYSDGEMLKISWLRDGYFETYKIDSIVISQDDLRVKYK